MLFNFGRTDAEAEAPILQAPDLRTGEQRERKRDLLKDKAFTPSESSYTSYKRKKA